MAFLEAFRVALRDLGMHKLRTLLTMLGMVFGVGAVLAMLSIGAGAEREALATIEKMGLRNIIVQAKTFELATQRILRQDSPGLSKQDMEALRKVLPPDTKIAGKKELKTQQIASALGKSDARVLGVGPLYPFAVGLSLVEGNFFLEVDDKRAHQVCVLGTTARQKLFGLNDPIGQFVKINREWFRVIGVLADLHVEKEEFQGVRIENPANHVYIPLSTLLEKFEVNPIENELDEIVIHLAPGSDLREQASLISSMMASMHAQLDDFNLVVPERLLQQSRHTQSIFNIVMGAIASISLLVGGIGIMNIMLASVLERTNEIGVRRAVGARRRDISRQFILEAVAIGVSGALLGIALGFGIASMVARYSGWPTLVTPWAIALSVGVSVSIGLCFGIYPARKAALVSPIEALRHE